MPLPHFRPDGWMPEGHHVCTWEDIEERFAGPPASPRRAVFDRLKTWRDSARMVGLSGLLILDGSFVSTKPDPGDFDTIFVYDDSCEDILANDPVANQLISLTAGKAAGHDLLAFARQNMIDFPEWYHIDCFDTDSRTGLVKGVLEVEL